MSCSSSRPASVVGNERIRAYSTYVKTNIAWAPPLPAHWSVRAGKQLFRREQRPVQPDYGVVTCFRDGMVTLRSKRRTTGFTEAIQESGYQGVLKGDLVIHAMDAFAGAVGVSDSDGKCTPVYAVLSPQLESDANPEYFSRVVREMARAGWIAALARGIRERSTDFRFESFRSQPLPVPPREEQDRIVAYLTDAEARIDRLIRNKRRLIALLNEEKQAIIQQAVTRGLDPDAPLKPSGVEWLGDIPAHWEAKALKHVLHRLIDCEHKTAPATEHGSHRVVRTAAVRDGKLKLAGTYLTTPDGFAEWTKRGIPEAGDVIFTREAPAGEACLVPGDMQLCLGQRTVLMKVDQRLFDSQFLVHMLYGGPPLQRIKLASQGSTVGHFNIADIGSLPILVPPIHEQREIVDWVSREVKVLENAIDSATREIDLIREYRIRLIADVVTGQLDVRDVQFDDDSSVENLDLGEVELLDEDDVSLEETDEMLDEEIA